MEKSVKQKFDAYPTNINHFLMEIRKLIYLAATDSGIEKIEETLKWGEPSYLVKGGSTVRIDWKQKTPTRCGVYFNCKTKLIDTFKEIYGNTFVYEGNRAIILDIDDEIPLQELRHCISLSLRYHKIKRLPLLGGK